MLFRVDLQEEKLNQMKIKVDQQEEELRTSTENPDYGMLKYTANYFNIKFYFKRNSVATTYQGISSEED